MKIESGKLMAEFRLMQRCEVCGGNSALQTHHEPTVGSAGLETRLTLIRVCVWCHGQRHVGTMAHLMKLKITAAICRREKCLAADREAVVLLLKRAPKNSSFSWFAFECKLWPDSACALLVKVLDEAGITEG